MKPEILAQMKLVAEGGLDAPPEVTLELIVEVERLRGIIRWVEQSGGCVHAGRVDLVSGFVEFAVAENE